MLILVAGLVGLMFVPFLVLMLPLSIWLVPAVAIGAAAVGISRAFGHPPVTPVLRHT